MGRRRARLRHPRPRVDEAIDVCRRLWTDEVIEHHGEFFDFGPTNFEPKPVRPGGAPSTSGATAPLPSAGRRPWERGWMPMNHSLEQMPASIARIKELAADAGRTDPMEFTFNGRIDSLDDVQRYADAGITRVVHSPWARSSEAMDGMRRFAEEVIEPSAPSPASDTLSNRVRPHPRSGARSARTSGHFAYQNRLGG